MNKSLSRIAFALLLVFLYASSEAAVATACEDSQNGTYGAQSRPSAQAGSSTQHAGTSSSQPNRPSTNVPGGATDASGGGVAETAGSGVGKSQTPQSPETPSMPTAPSDSDLQAQLQNALSKEPTLSGDTVNVTVTGNSIDITGSVATAREKQTATRIVQSYAGNKKVASHLTVTGRNRNAAPGAINPKTTREENGTGGDLSSRPEPNTDTPDARAKRLQG